MKKLIFLTLCAALLAACSSPSKDVYMFTSFHEPHNEGLRLLYSHDGKLWHSVGSCIFLEATLGQGVMRDPSIVRDKNGIFHLVWTTGWRDDLGFGYANSKDLITWSIPQFIPVMEHEPTTVNVWAPEIFYDDEEDRYIIIWASTIPYRFEVGTESETNNQRMYYTITEDFVNFTETQLFYDPGFNVIDAVIVKRAKNDYALVLKDNSRAHRFLRMAFADNPLGPWSEAGEPFTGRYAEGPNVLKLSDYYYIFFDAYCHESNPNPCTPSYDAVKTKDFNTFVNATSEVSFPEGHKHGTIFKASEEILKNVKKYCAEKQ